MQILRTCKLLLLFFCIGITGAYAQTTEELMEKADFLISNSRYEEALTILDQALKSAPKDAGIHYKKAETLIGLAQFKEAVGMLEKTVQLNPKFIEAFEMLGNLYSQFRKAPQAVKNYEQAYAIASAKAAAEADAEAQARINSDRLRYKIEIVQILFIVRRHKFAKPHIDAALELEPDNFDVKFMKVQYHNEIEEYQESIAIMEELIKEVPEEEGNEKYFFELGLAYHMTAQYKKAQEQFDKIKFGPELSRIRQYQHDYYYSVSMAYFTVYAFDQAEKYLDIALAIKPDYKEALELKLRLGGVKSSKGAQIGNMQELIKVEKDPAKLAENYKLLADLHYQSEEYEEAMTACQESLNINEKQLDVVFLMAMCEYKLQKADAATAMLDKIVKNPSLNPSVKARFHFARGLIYKAAGNLGAAESAFKSAYTGNYRAAARNELTSVFKLKMKGEATVEDIAEDSGEEGSEEGSEEGGEKK
jgi:tetratricopeptide (TPR) repeat protein